MTSLTKFAIPVLLTTAGAATAAFAQSSPGLIDLRVGKLEKEVRAVQRVVFPQGVPVQPDLNAVNSPLAAPGNAASAPIADLNARVDALEKQVAALTGTSEQNAYRIRQMESALATLQGRVTTIEGAGQHSAETIGANDGASEAGALAPSARDGRPRAGRLGESGTSAAPTMGRPGGQRPAPTKADPARKAEVSAVEMPSTGDAVEDDYTYGFRLYAAKLYPEAEAKLKEFAAKYPPTSRRWSYAQNLLGRAYYDEGKPALASVAFYDNYQKAPQGERVVDSLTWLGQALINLKKPTDACKVYGVLTEDYAGKLNSEQRTRAAKGRADAKCAA